VPFVENTLLQTADALTSMRFIMLSLLLVADVAPYKIIKDVINVFRCKIVY